METAFANDLRRLTNALLYDGFRFILIGHNRHSLYVDIAKQLRTTFANRPFLELQLRDKPYRELVDEILAFPKGIILIPDFDWLFQPGNETVRVAFNQRRDAFARRNVAFICFIEPNSWHGLAEKLPDWWSLRSLELDFHRETADFNLEFLPANEETSSLGGETKQEKEAEIERLLKQLEAVDSDNKPLLLSLNNQIGSIWFSLSNYEIALFYLEQALRIAREIGDKSGEGINLNNISQIYSARGDYETALTYLQQGLNIQQQIGNNREEGAILNNISQIYKAQGDHQTALNYLQQSLGIQQQIGDKSGQSASLNNLATLAYTQGDYETAWDYLQQSLSIKQEIGDTSGEATTLNNISQIYKAQGDYETALTYLQQSLNITREIGNKSGEGTVLNNIGVLYAEQFQDVEQAIRLLWSAYSIFQEIGSPNAKITKSFLKKIQSQIGESRFQEILQSIPNDSSANNL